MRSVRASPLTTELTSTCCKFGVAIGDGEMIRPRPLNGTWMAVRHLDGSCGQAGDLRALANFEARILLHRGWMRVPDTGLKTLIVQLGSVPAASVKLTGRLRRVASLRAARRPLLIDSAVERTSLLRTNVVNDGIPSINNIPVIVSATITSRNVKPRSHSRHPQQSPLFRVTQHVLDEPAPAQPGGRLAVLRALAWLIV